MQKARIRKFGLSVLSLLSVTFTAYAGGGYWEYRKVCQYETVTVNDPVTHCSYSGTIYADVPYVQRPVHASANDKLNGHVSCPAEKSVSRTLKMEVDDGIWEFVRYQGNISLVDQSQSYDSRQETRVIEGSCRMERVWVPCETNRGCNGEP